MNRAASSFGQPVTVAIVFLCMLGLALIQILGPTARLNHDFASSDLAGPEFAALTEIAPGAHAPLPSRCASIKLAPVEIETAQLPPTGVVCSLVSAYTSSLPPGAELGVPTPPPRQA